MNSTRRGSLASTIVAALLAIPVGSTLYHVQQDDTRKPKSWSLPTIAQISAKAPLFSAFVLTAQSVSHALTHSTSAPWVPAVNVRKLRGATQYVAVAPSVVVVRTQVGHGTGFFVRSGGVLITNNHVIATGLWHDGKGSYAMIHTGKLGADGVMQLDAEPQAAHVLKHNAAKDLAILKIDATSSEAAPYLRLADSSPRPGMPIFIVGHPSSGMLWTYRSGEISSIGYSPKDMVNVLMPILAASEADRQTARQYLSQSESEKILLTSAVANPGDSGGPVVNADGRVVAVTFAVPSAPGEKAFSYHIHLDEVRNFIREVPTRAIYVIPDPWDIGPEVRLLDLDSDGKPDVLVAGTGSPEEIMFDLGNQTPASLIDNVHLRQLIEQRAWRCDFAFRFSDGVAFYDRDGDGQIDLIVQRSRDDATLSESRFFWTDGRWRYESYRGRLVDPSYLTDPGRARRLSAMLTAISK